MNKAAHHALALSLCAILLGACAPLPPVATPASIAHQQARERLANNLATKGDLAGALVQWKILKLLHPDQPMYTKNIEQLAKRISTASESHLKLAQEALQLGDDSKAEMEFLKVLALDPKHPSPPAYLREIERRQMLGSLLAKQNGKMYQDPFDAREDPEGEINSANTLPEVKEPEKVKPNKPAARPSTKKAVPTPKSTPRPTDTK